MQILLPDGWPRPKGYSNGIVAEGKMVFLAGQIGWDENQEFASLDLVDQFRQTLINIRTLLSETNAGPEHVVRMTWFITSRDEYLQKIKEIGGVYRDIFGKNYPVMSVVEIKSLVETHARVEIEVTAVIPYESR